MTHHVPFTDVHGIRHTYLYSVYNPRTRKWLTTWTLSRERNGGWTEDFSKACKYSKKATAEKFIETNSSKIDSYKLITIHLRYKLDGEIDG